MQLTPIIAGIGTGLLSVLLLAALVNGSPLAIPFFLASPLPIAIAGFTWGTRASAIAALTVLVAILFAAGLAPALGGFLVVALPMALAIHLFGLWRDLGGEAREWYPLGEILLRVTALIGFGLVVVGAVSGFNPELLAADMAATMEAWFDEANVVSRPGDVAALADFVFSVLPVTMAGLGVAIFVANIALGARIATTSQRPLRPRPPLWSVQLPPIASYVLAGAALLSLLPGALGDAASAVAGAFGVALAIVGLGVLHGVTLGRPGRGGLLFIAYASIPLLGIPFILFALLGVFDSFSRLRPPAPTPTT
ncbi:MAG: hypothetical protein AB7O56_06500 [Bauldia sp.]